MTRKPWSHVRILIHQACAITQDSSRERALIFIWQVKPNKTTIAKDVTKLLDPNLGELAAGGNLNQVLSLVSSFAQALNEQDIETQSEEDIEANKQVLTFFLMFCYCIVCLVFHSVHSFPRISLHFCTLR